MIAPMTFLLLHASVAGTLLTNGDFEKGLDGWATRQSWYERPKGAGLSEILAAPGEGRQGSNFSHKQFSVCDGKIRNSAQCAVGSTQ